MKQSANENEKPYEEPDTVLADDHIYLVQAPDLGYMSHAYTTRVSAEAAYETLTHTMMTSLCEDNPAVAARQIEDLFGLTAGTFEPLDDKGERVVPWVMISAVKKRTNNKLGDVYHEMHAGEFNQLGYQMDQLISAAGIDHQEAKKFRRIATLFYDLGQFHEREGRGA